MMISISSRGWPKLVAQRLQIPQKLSSKFEANLEDCKGYFRES